MYFVTIENAIQAVEPQIKKGNERNLKAILKNVIENKKRKNKTIK